MFRNRIDAAQQLAAALKHYQDRKPLVLAIPRGAVPMGKVIAEQLDSDFDVVLVRKLRAPRDEELAIGAIDESGHVYISEIAEAAGATAAYLEQEKQQQLATIRERRGRYTPVHAPIDPAGRVVIVVDDGLATGATMQAALQSLRAHKPEKLICAVPVAPQDTLQGLTPLTDEMVCLQKPAHFMSVGQFYQDFDQVSDRDVITILASCRQSSCS